MHNWQKDLPKREKYEQVSPVSFYTIALGCRVSSSSKFLKHTQKSEFL